MKRASIGVAGGMGLLAVVAGAALHSPPPGALQCDVSAADYATLQAALDANPGRTIHVPDGDYEISAKLRLRGDHAVLCGRGRIIQTNPKAPILEIERAADVIVRDLVLTRSADAARSTEPAVVAIDCDGLVLDGVQVVDHRSPAAAIRVSRGQLCQIRNCRVENYMAISVDDRTGSPDWGYAFQCIDGTGIALDNCRGALVQGNRVIERDMLPTPEMQDRHGLGKFVKRAAQKGAIISQEVWDRGYVDNWHQGSAIVVTGPRESDCIQIIGNYIENAAQGIDLHADHVIVSGNIVNNAFAGMKAMHGSRHVLIVGNQFIKNDLWAIGLMPGAASSDGRAGEPNYDHGSIVASNVISEFGYGNARWIWDGPGRSTSPIWFDAGQKPDNPPLSDVVIQGNVVYNSAIDQHGVGAPGQPRYRYAVRVSPGDTGPKNLHFFGNLFQPGEEGVANIELAP